METVNKDIEFQALQAQINPHFLYNVLDTINWMARKKGEDNICRMVTSISSLMRASISNKRSMVYIREEINMYRIIFTYRKPDMEINLHLILKWMRD